ncbi:unnamed protein product [Euphydryas editha]|uniref:PHD-type domain-containing protein n=1 Tax=Euphydryas editha TaxID=104508 RepID=A0AAU9TSP7_EUPED|nr:unnamed protein product [Euphydryas editha]
MTNECLLCKNNILVTQKRIKCCKCQTHYHLDCVTLNNNSNISRTQWVCMDCSFNTRKGNLNTPKEKKSCQENNIPQVQATSQISREVQEIITTTINIEFEKVREELSVLQSIKESIDHFSHLYDCVKRELEEAKEEIKNLKRDNCELRNILNSHSDVINNLEKEARASNIELHCLPEFRNENLVNTVEQISKVINVPITEGEKTPVFISEHLTSASRDIHAAARLFAKEKQYRYVWSRNGNIFLRKSAASDVIFVKSKNILKNLD